MTASYEFDFSILPDGFAPLAAEPSFDASKHLQLEAPTEVLSLHDLGYDDAAIAVCPSDFAVTNVFRILSDEGAACLYEVSKQLENFTRSNERIQRNTRGGVYRSKFLRDLCLNQEVADFMGKIAGLDLLPHTIAHQLGHLNYAPFEIGTNVDKWHVDTLRYDYVMFVTDPKSHHGGQFQYYKGTKDEVASLTKAGKPLDPEKIISPVMPGPGYAVMQQGNMVVHQAKGLTKEGERITMVNGYIPANPLFPDFSRYDQLVLVDPSDVVAAEYNHHVSVHAQRLLQHVMETKRFSSDKEVYAEQLSKVADMLEAAAQDIRDGGKAKMEHFGD